MKKYSYLFAVLTVLALPVKIQAQLPVLQFGERLPNLYYWDSNWFDYKVLNHSWSPGTLIIGNIGTTQDYNMAFCAPASFSGRACLATEPLKVIGIDR